MNDCSDFRPQKPFGVFAACALPLLAAACLPRPACAGIRYTVSLADRPAHMFQITMTVPAVHGSVEVAMPEWNATYVIRDFAARVEDVRASQAGRPVPVRALAGDTWRIEGNGTVQIRYRIYWDSPGPFSTQLDVHHAFINFAEILFYVPALRAEESEVEFTGVPAGWKVAVELPPASGCPSRTCYSAGSYDLLTDAPALLGTFSDFAFVESGAHLRVAIDAMDGAKWDQGRIEGWLRSIVRYETGMMRSVPFHEYLFIYLLGPGAGGGGMEHANGTAIGLRDASEIPSVTAHEFFHLWNVKRIRPQSLTPYDYQHPMWTRSLWFAEGVTSTYGAYALLRSGLWTPAQYLDHLGEQISELQARPARLWQSVEEASLDTWFDSEPFYNQPDRSISYYNKGELDGVLLDILIRDSTSNHKSLDDLLRTLYAEFPARHRFYRSGDIEALAERVAGRSFAGFFRDYVAGTAEIPWSDILGRAGLGVEARAVPVADAGFAWQVNPGGQAEVSEVDTDGPAAKAGIEEGDIIVSAGDAPLPRFAAFWLRAHHPGESIELRISRNGREMTLPFTFAARNESLYVVAPLDNPNPEQRRILNGILHGTTD